MAVEYRTTWTRSSRSFELAHSNIVVCIEEAEHSAYLLSGLVPTNIAVYSVETGEAVLVAVGRLCHRNPYRHWDTTTNSTYSAFSA